MWRIRALEERETNGYSGNVLRGKDVITKHMGGKVAIRWESARH